VRYRLFHVAVCGLTPCLYIKSTRTRFTFLVKFECAPHFARCIANPAKITANNSNARHRFQNPVAGIDSFSYPAGGWTSVSSIPTYMLVDYPSGCRHIGLAPVLASYFTVPKAYQKSMCCASQQTSTSTAELKHSDQSQAAS
jgi:hypothetical protein